MGFTVKKTIEVEIESGAKKLTMTHAHDGGIIMEISGVMTGRESSFEERIVVRREDIVRALNVLGVEGAS